MTQTKDYAEKIEIMIGCKEKTDILQGEYLDYISRRNAKPTNRTQIINSIRRFLMTEKGAHVDMYGPKTTSAGSTCMEVGLAGLLLAERNGVPATFVFVKKNTAVGDHYLICTEERGKWRDNEIMFRRSTVEQQQVLIRRELSPEEVARHVKYIGIPMKMIGWRRIVKTVHSLRDAKAKLATKITRQSVHRLSLL